MRVLVIGGSGMLGRDLLDELRAAGHEVVSPSSHELDITDPESVAQISSMDRFDWCINCAAYTAVDQAESDEAAAYALNALGPGYLARMCAMRGIPLLHVSTDFVFDGGKVEDYTEEDQPNPLGVYGKSKLAGEEAVLQSSPMSIVARTSWLFGPHGKSFPRTMIQAWKAGKHLKVVADQTGKPTYTPDLAKVLVQMCAQRAFPGIYHVTGPEKLSWFEFAKDAITVYKEFVGETNPVEVEPIQTSDWPTPAKRPANSSLSNEKLIAAGIEPLPPFKQALADFVRRLEF
ncbi:MAG TPA: dTDP-4-dehydrorhamnose reductase [Fimbriimonadaceae bacterium]|nr:dTDP-4-dehydrorhamnose reductase [Fimbriimonadaceae bacterium]